MKKTILTTLSVGLMNIALNAQWVNTQPTNYTITVQKGEYPAGYKFASYNNTQTPENSSWSNQSTSNLHPETYYLTKYNECVQLGGIISSNDYNGDGTADHYICTRNFTVNAGIAYTAGNVGIGTATPSSSAKLDVAGKIKITDGTQGVGKVLVSDANGLASWVSQGLWQINGNNISYISGNVGIGTTATTGYKLSVEGNIRARDVEVNVATWADYVFDEKYKLLSLEEAEKFIKEQGHLYGVPSAKEVTSKGIKLGEMDAILLKKIEELTLYIIEQDKKIKQLQEKK